MKVTKSLVVVLILIILSLVAVVCHLSRRPSEAAVEVGKRTPVLDVSYAMDAKWNCFAYVDSATYGGHSVRSITYMGVALAAANACPK